MMEDLCQFIDLKPKLLAKLVYGDTNSTLSGALAAAKIHTPVVHMEAGLRSFNKKMPEEINRILTDHLSSLLLCPSETAIENLNNEGINSGVMDVGDIMVDAANKAQAIVHNNNSYLPKVENFDFLNAFDLLTLHRAENTDDDSRLRAIFEAFSFADRPILFPIHPRTKKIIGEHGIELPELVMLCEPLSYLAMATILNRVSNVITDSGGLQKEAYWVGKPCITLRDETEWVETLEGGANRLVGADKEKIIDALKSQDKISFSEHLYGDGNAASSSVKAMMDFFQ